MLLSLGEIFRGKKFLCKFFKHYIKISQNQLSSKLLISFIDCMKIKEGRRHSIGYIYIGLNCTFVSAVFNFSLPDIVMLTSAHLYQLYITHLYRKFFNITIRYYTMTKWFSYSKITPIFTYVISFLEIEMHLLNKIV